MRDGGQDAAVAMWIATQDTGFAATGDIEDALIGTEGFEVDPSLRVWTTPEAYMSLEERLRATTEALLRERSKLTTTQVVEQIVQRQMPPPIVGLYDHKNNIVNKVPQDCALDPRVRKFSLLACAQGGKTMTCMNAIAAWIATQPGPIMFMYPVDSIAKRKVKEDIGPMFASSELLSQLVMEEKDDKLKRNTLLRWTFPGGALQVVSAQSNSEIKSSPFQYGVVDEKDRIKMLASGDPTSGMEMRQTKFGLMAKTINASTIEGSESTSLIYADFMDGDQSEPLMRCPSCGHNHIPQWENVDWEEGKGGQILPSTAWYGCPSCGMRMSDSVRYAMQVNSLTWRQLGEWDCSCGRHVNPKKDADAKWTMDPVMDELSVCPSCGNGAPMEHRSFRWNILHCQVPLRVVVEEWRLAQNKPDKMKVFVNERLARGWSLGTEEMQAKDVRTRLTVDYGHEYARQADGTPVLVPDFAKCVVAACDTGHDHLQVSFRAYGDGMRSGGVFYKRIMGQLNDARTWNALEELRMHLWPGVEGRLYPCSLLAIDVGDGSMREHIRPWVRRRMQSGVLPIRGTEGGSIFTAEQHLMGDRTPHHPVGKISGLTVLGQRLRLDPRDQGGKASLPLEGSMVYPRNFDPDTGANILRIRTREGTVFESDYDDRHFAELVNWRLRDEFTSARGSFVKHERVHTNVREEPADNEVYLMAAIQHLLRINGLPQDANGARRIEDLSPKWIQGAFVPGSTTLQPVLVPSAPAIVVPTERELQAALAASMEPSPVLQVPGRGRSRPLPPAGRRPGFRTRF